MKLKDGVETFVDLDPDVFSNTLYASVPDFELPTDAKEFIVVTRAFVMTPNPSKFDFQLWSGGVAIGDMLRAPCELETDGWLEVLFCSIPWEGSTLSLAQINAPDFGVTVYVENTSGEPNWFRVDVVEMTIYYKSRHRP
jgi:hypothetical protein